MCLSLFDCFVLLHTCNSPVSAIFIHICPSFSKGFTIQFLVVVSWFVLLTVQLLNQTTKGTQGNQEGVGGNHFMVARKQSN